MFRQIEVFKHDLIDELLCLEMIVSYEAKGRHLLLPFRLLPHRTAALPSPCIRSANATTPLPPRPDKSPRHRGGDLSGR